MNTTMGIRGFLLLWSAQLVSIVGSALTGFVLGVWTYERSGSATQFALIMLSGAIPALLIAPFAGALTDRLHRRRILAAADCVALATVGALALLISSDQLQTWHIYPATALTAMCGTVHQITFSAMIPLLVPKQHLSRANGLSQVVFSAQIAAPIVAGTLLAAVGLRGVVLVDLVTFGVSLLVVLLVPLPRAAVRTASPEPGAPSIWSQVPDGWAELRRRPGLTGLLAVLGGFYFCFGIAGTLVRPLVLSFAGPTGLGFQVFAGGCGLFAGSLVMGVWGGPKKRMRGIALFMAIGGVALAIHSLAPSLALVIAIGPFFLFTLPVITGTAQTLLQTKVDPANLGKVMATSRAISQAASPLAYIVAGPLADGVFEPLMRPGGGLAGSMGQLIGTGPGRGMALMFLLAGVLLVVLGALAARPSLRRVEDLPDLMTESTGEDVREPAVVPAIREGQRK
ncbi:MFS transporter [Amycolatopsis sp. H20-H5]|uniref:MFS transporter n=1 Tax=Amycolatopsis sp. H20-H5 TaxID=3046309 RepID=UPI002DBEE86F|nr:MFS transporter [Amycolatopsis sp. H20-H5]MEC3979519.1 MFS transporter [Amycolatopsis sp. H20-H5]